MRSRRCLGKIYNVHSVFFAAALQYNLHQQYGKESQGWVRQQHSFVLLIKGVFDAAGITHSLPSTNCFHLPLTICSSSHLSRARASEYLNAGHAVPTRVESRKKAKKRRDNRTSHLYQSSIKSRSPLARRIFPCTSPSRNNCWIFFR